MRKNNYTASEFFQLIFKKSYPNLKPKDMGRKLLAKGQKEADTIMSLKLMACIGAIDRLIFDGKPITLNFSTRPNRYGHFAGYSKATKTHGESYEVTVSGIAKTMKGELKARVTMLGKKSPPYYDLPKASLEEILIGVAIHEVRHRMQYQPGIKTFSRKYYSYAGGKLRRYINFTKLLFREERKVYVKEGKSVGFIRDRMKKTEFDAKLIEIIAVTRIHNGVSINELKSLINLQPNEPFQAH